MIEKLRFLYFLFLIFFLFVYLLIIFRLFLKIKIKYIFGDVLVVRTFARKNYFTELYCIELTENIYLSFFGTLCIKLFTRKLHLTK